MVKVQALRLSGFFAAYTATWVSFCILALIILVRDRASLLPEWRRYLNFLAAPIRAGIKGADSKAIKCCCFVSNHEEGPQWDPDAALPGVRRVIDLATGPREIALAYSVPGVQKLSATKVGTLAVIFVHDRASTAGRWRLCKNPWVPWHSRRNSNDVECLPRPNIPGGQQAPDSRAEAVGAAALLLVGFLSG